MYVYTHTSADIVHVLETANFLDNGAGTLICQGRVENMVESISQPLAGFFESSTVKKGVEREF